MASKYTAYMFVHCGDMAGVEQAGIGKLLAEGWELWGDPFIRNTTVYNNTVYQVMVKPAVLGGQSAGTSITFDPSLTVDQVAATLEALTAYYTSWLAVLRLPEASEL